MSTFKILVSNADHMCNFWRHDFDDLFSPHFSFDIYDPAATYDIKTTVVYLSELVDYSWAVPLLDKGYRAIIDNLWESTIVYNMADVARKYKDNVLIVTSGSNHDVTHNLIEVPAWFWYLESKSHSMSNRAFRQRASVPKTKKAFMPVRRQSIPRDYVFSWLDTQLNDIHYSYLGRGIPLIQGENMESDDRVIDIKWYEETYFSVIVETHFDLRCHVAMTIPFKNVYSMATNFITEKTFKPIAYQHPFITISNPYSLRELKELGFATFDNIFNESYDNEVSLYDRVNLIKKQIQQFDISKYNDPETVKRTEHNFNHFYNETEVNRRVQQEIINPVLEFLNAKA